MGFFENNNNSDYANSVLKAKEALARGEQPSSSDMERVRKAAQYMDGDIGREARSITGK